MRNIQLAGSETGQMVVCLALPGDNLRSMMVTQTQQRRMGRFAQHDDDSGRERGKEMKE